MLKRSVQALTTSLAGQYVVVKAENDVRELKAQIAEMRESSEDKENKYNQNLEKLLQKIEKEKRESLEKSENGMKLLQAEMATVSKHLQLSQEKAAEREEMMREQLRKQSETLVNIHEENNRRHKSELQKQLLEAQGQRDQEVRVKEEMKAKWEEKEKLLMKDLKDLQMKHLSEVQAEKDRHANMKTKIDQEWQEKYNNKMSSMAEKHHMEEKNLKDQIQKSKEKRDLERVEESKEVKSTLEELQKAENHASEVLKWLRKTFDPKLVKSIKQSNEALENLYKKFEDEHVDDTIG